MPAPDYVLHQGDEGQTITIVCTDEDGPVDIEGADVRFLMARLTGGDAIVAEDAENENDTALGQVSYEWQGADTATPGHFVASVEVTFVGGAVVTFPNGGYVHVQIVPQLTEAAP